MHILKRGIPPDTIQHRGNCLYCGCEFEFLSSEAVRESTCRNEDYLKIKCPTCSKEVWVQL